VVYINNRHSSTFYIDIANQEQWNKIMAKKSASQGSSSKFSGREIVKAAIELGAKKAKIVSPGNIVTAHWVRWKCRYGCSGYQSNLMCPPYTPLPAETRQMLDQYKRAVLFEAGRGRPKKIAVALERTLFLQGFYRAFGMGAGSCHLCKECAFEQGCRKPELARPALESCGIDVFATVRRHGFTIHVVRDEKDIPHYFGLVLFD
jgi:predicted metal-binding protein